VIFSIAFTVVVAVGRAWSQRQREQARANYARDIEEGDRRS
jgi:hypothetical protein